MVSTRFRRIAATAWSEWLRPIVLILLVVGGVRSVLADWHDVPTQSMEPTILVLGDNRDNSRDSRAFGVVPREDIAGRVIGVAFSLDLDRGLAPRADRFAIGVD